MSGEVEVETGAQSSGQQVDVLEQLIKVEASASGSSRCRATGGLIEVGEPRIGLEGNMNGRTVIAWQKPMAFLQRCGVEISPNSRAKCKKTGNILLKGEPRFVCLNGNQRFYLTLHAAASELVAVMKIVQFNPGHVRGLTDLSDTNKKRYCELFSINESDIETVQFQPEEQEAYADNYEDEQSEGEEEEEDAGAQTHVDDEDYKQEDDNDDESDEQEHDSDADFDEDDEGQAEFQDEDEDEDGVAWESDEDDTSNKRKRKMGKQMPASTKKRKY
eukprot:TRINITY_DN5638_c0_g1_i1.p1 TRINITY_DN5638_c0_g1~~TRINITY_DN5638_c0_g1_i1.p1  ORF type:complete len:274 (+),score=57.50 TRINITY_DN5638_c0_g1_i1:85-906(+)